MWFDNQGEVVAIKLSETARPPPFAPLSLTPYEVLQVMSLRVVKEVVKDFLNVMDASAPPSLVLTIKVGV